MSNMGLRDASESKKNITVFTGTLIPFCEAILGYFGIIDILFSHPVSKLGELKV